MPGASDGSLGHPRDPRRIYEILLEAHGPQHWWPGESAFEVAAGAILVQSTAWRNAASAIARLAEGDWLEPTAILDLPVRRLQQLIRPAGFFRQKSRTLRSFSAWLVDAGGFGALRARPTARVRADLVALHGIGPETADSILLYALDRPVFVVDAYARRLLTRTGVRPDAGIAGYSDLGRWIHEQLPADAGLLGEYHALMVAHGKTRCRPRPLCPGCPLEALCDYAAGG
jgi:endonuclease-3 related protein